MAFIDSGDTGEFGWEGHVTVLEKKPDWEVVTDLHGDDIGDSASMLFGSSVAIDGETLMVGRPIDDFQRDDAGSVEVYRLEGSRWRYLTDLQQSYPTTGSQFGSDLVLRGREVLVAGHGSGYHEGSGGAFMVQDTSEAGDWSETRQTRLVAWDDSFLQTAGSLTRFRWLVRLRRTRRHRVRPARRKWGRRLERAEGAEGRGRGPPRVTG